MEQVFVALTAGYLYSTKTKTTTLELNQVILIIAHIAVLGWTEARHDHFDAGDDGMGADAVFSVFGGQGLE